MFDRRDRYSQGRGGYNTTVHAPLYGEAHHMHLLSFMETTTDTYGGEQQWPVSKLAKHAPSSVGIASSSSSQLRLARASSGMHGAVRVSLLPDATYACRRRTEVLSMNKAGLIMHACMRDRPWPAVPTNCCSWLLTKQWLVTTRTSARQLKHVVSLSHPGTVKILRTYNTRALNNDHRVIVSPRPFISY